MNPKLLILIPILSAAAVFGAAALQYRSEAGRVVNVAMEDTGDVSGMVAQELRALFSEVPPAISQYQAVTEKNLFSPDRKAWQQPPPPAADPVEEPPPPPQPSSGSSRIRLYGTTFGADKGLALLYFERFASDRKHRLVRVGESVTDGGEGHEERYLLRELEPDKAVLTDAQGLEIIVGLYDHVRSAPVVAAPPSVPRPRPQAPPPQLSPVQAAPPPPEVHPQGEPIRRMEDIPASEEEREQLAREGRLLKIDTPFGPVFRPVD